MYVKQVLIKMTGFMNIKQKDSIMKWKRKCMTIFRKPCRNSVSDATKSRTTRGTISFAATISATGRTAPISVSAQQHTPTTKENAPRTPKTSAIISKPLKAANPLHIPRKLSPVKSTSRNFASSRYALLKALNAILFPSSLAARWKASIKKLSMI